MRRHLLAGLAALALANCGGQTSERLRLAAVTVNGTDPFWISLRCGAVAEAKRLGVRLDWHATSRIDLSTQTMNLQAALLKRPDGLILAPGTPAGFVTDVERLMADGVPVAVVSGRLTRPVHYVRLSTDTRAEGPYGQLAQRIAQHAEGRGSIAVLAGIPGTDLDAPRREPLEAALRRVAPRIRVLRPEFPGTDRVKAAAITAGLIARHPDLKAVFATSGPEGMGASQAANEQLDRRVAVFAYDATPEQVAALRKGHIKGLLAQSPERMGRDAVRALVHAVRAGAGRRARPIMPAATNERFTPTLVLTRENVDGSRAGQFMYRRSCA